MKTCPRCQQPFDCRPDAIHDCACAHVALTDNERAYIQAYTAEALGGYVCLCVRCLNEVAACAPPFKKQSPPDAAIHNGSVAADVVPTSPFNFP